MKKYTIKEATEKLNISRATLYNKIKLKEEKLKKHITTEEGKKYISAIGIEILEKNETIDSNETSYQQTSNNDNSESKILMNENNFLKSQIEFLQGQLDKKDDQIKTLSELVKNSQILLKNEQETKLIETPAKNIFSWFKKKGKTS